jgi:hypothetical protein
MTNKLIAIDFDGTLVKHEFPDIGEWLPHAERVAQRLCDAGHRLILNTCRENERRRKYLAEAVEHCERHGITFVSVNENRPEDDFRENGGRKVYAHLYIDDRNIPLGHLPGQPCPNWLLIEQWMEDNGWLSSDNKKPQ